MARQSDEADERYHERRKRDENRRKQLPGPDDEPLPPPAETIRSDAKPRRNDPCPCGSGKKYKQCCGKM
ncbi:MAG: SEC-C metal-binding domain-containing protein [Planctomycetota bacterium]|jgi:preprotein translocase subunit SecA